VGDGARLVPVTFLRFLMKLWRKKKNNVPTATRYGDVFRSARERERKHLRHRWQWILLAVFVLLGVIAGYLAYYYYTLQGDVQKEVGNVAPADRREDPFNVLLVGSDSREGLTEKQKLELGAGDVEGGGDAERADTLILAHIDPETSKVTMVQFPRDLWVPVGKRNDKINAALMGGPERIVETVENLTGLAINHYVQVNIVGFRDLIEAIGGVEVCVPEPIPFDEQTGLQVTEEEVGMVQFGGDDALRFVRSRNFASGDFERIQNQQKFIAAALDKVLSSSTILQPGRVNALADVARNNVDIDQNTTLKGLAEIGSKLRNFDPDTYEAYTAPNLGTGFKTVGGDEISVVVGDFDTMEVMFEAIAANESPAQADGVPSISPQTIRVGVYNGVGLERAVAGPARDKLEAATTVGGEHVQVVEVANAKNFRFRGTTIVANSKEPEAERMAELVAAAIPGAEVEVGKTKPGVDVAVIVGRGRFRTEKVTQILPIPIPKPGDLPEVCARDQASGD
jgi:LCP family protein required for cell wall assembly